MTLNIAERCLKMNEEVAEKLKVSKRSVFENRRLFQGNDSKWTSTGTGAPMPVLELVVEVGDDWDVSFEAMQITRSEIRAKNKVMIKRIKWDAFRLINFLSCMPENFVYDNGKRTAVPV